MSLRKAFVVMLITVFVSGALYGQAQDVVSKLFPDDLKISGDFVIIAKYEDGFATPLDSPEAGLFNRAGANYRASQNFRAHGKLNFSVGKPGVSPWFGVMQIRVDANDPDVKYFYDPSNLEASDSETTEEVVEIDNFFVMYRPFEVKGGRPFGITLGVGSVKATANAAYSHFYIGDTEDEDFVFYTASALTTFPMVQLDFHVTPDTGIGAALVRGAGDISLIGTGMNIDSALNKVVWFEAKKWGFGLNGAAQFVSGEAGGTKVTRTEVDNEIYEYDGKYKHTLLNAQIVYDLKGFMPYIGYQSVSGDQVPTDGAPSRSIDGAFLTYGANVDMKFLGLPGKFSADYTSVRTDDFNGMSGLPEGTLASVLASNPSLSGLAPYFVNYGGDSEVIWAVANLDYSYHLEYSIPVKKGLELSFFYYGLKGKKDSTLSGEAVMDDIADALRPYEGSLGGATAEQVAASIMAGGMSDSILRIQQFAELTDTNSVGMALKYSF